MRNKLIATTAALFCVSSALARELTFEDRVKAQEAIERVYYAHQIGSTRSFEEAVPRAVIERKVSAYLDREAALVAAGHTPISAQMLQREVRRIASSTRLPERLRELRAAVGDDPVLIAETVARPVLIDRLARGAAPDGGSDPCQGNNYWDNGSLDDAPQPRKFHTTVWTGSLMLVWGGNGGSGSGERYDPATDTWSAISLVGAPEGRFDHSAVWTGTRMIVWGGRARGPSHPLAVVQTGGAYDPVADAWTPTSTTGAPDPRWSPTAIWTGSRMIVWGGSNGVTRFQSGGVYDPLSDAWTATSIVNAPEGRFEHTAVWTGSSMIVWGGRNTSLVGLDTGGSYDPVGNQWTPTTLVDAPSSRLRHVAVWTGTRMIVWGGYGFGSPWVWNTGGVYDPITNTWTATTVAGAPPARDRHTGVWTGSRFIVWGGTDDSGTIRMSDGAAYDPDSGSWTPVAASGAPLGRYSHSAVWTGSRMIVWGGDSTDPNANHTGGRYDPATDSWEPTASGSGPAPSSFGQADTNVMVGYTTAVWTGNLALIWGTAGGASGARYDPALDAWTTMSLAGSPGARSGATAVWTGSEMIVWGGGNYFNSGAGYDPISDSWRATSSVGAPVARSNHSAVWTGTQMIVFGGLTDGFCEAGFLADGGRYDPATDSWQPITPLAGGARIGHVAVWTGSRMVIWGGHRRILQLQTCQLAPFGSGSRYDPATDSWSAMSNASAPSTRSGVDGVWSGSELLVWGGPTNTGGRYDPVADLWRPTSLTGAPSSRSGSRSVWTGRRMVVWGGRGNSERETSTGGIYDPVFDVWLPTSLSGAPAERSGHVQLWTGTEVFVWGGTTSAVAFGTNVGVASGGRLQFGREDADDDGTADVCDACPADQLNDADTDGLCADLDNCPSVANPSQTNGDGDAYGDACDACLVDNPNDVDGDGVCTSVDNCPTAANANQQNSDADGRGNACDNCTTVSNPHQFDGDADGKGDLCDNCPTVSNATQVDGDADGEGDACDCQPSDQTDRRPAETQTLSVERTGSTANLAWAATPLSDAYSVTRGELAALAPSQYGTCLAQGLVSTGFDDPAVPPPGQGFFYLVQAQNFDCGLGSLGIASKETIRANSNAAACTGVVVTDAHATAESTVFGTVSGTLADTLSTDSTYESITEVLSNGSPASMFSRLEQRWITSVGAGTRKELHVTGFYLPSLDGDAFQFEYSTNGTTFTPLALSLLWTSGGSLVDKVAELPGNPSGTITIRVVDTEHTAGHQELDSIHIDELWIRAVP